MSQLRQEKITALLKDLVSEYLARHNAKKVLVSVTGVALKSDLKSAKIFIGVFPDSEESRMLEKLESEKSEIKKHIAGKTSFKYLPSIVFEIDKGEKNRHRIEELLNM